MFDFLSSFSKKENLSAQLVIQRASLPSLVQENWTRIVFESKLFESNNRTATHFQFISLKSCEHRPTPAQSSEKLKDEH